mmetsp:Transcript_2489/g.2703  ORF Transcript_2489/g.2703 Transcript_2489/m.2703 type:complete len:357 (+) Transcript_2489:87-1157(+)
MGPIPGTTNQMQTISLVWIPRLTATLSFLGSLAIVYMILSDRKEKLTRSNHRLMLVLSVVDVLHSAVYAATTLASPRDSEFYGAMGNMGTCNAQGFFGVLAYAIPMYNTCLSLYFLLTIRYRMRLSTFSTKIEPFMHTLSTMVPLTLAIVSVSTSSIEPVSNVCFVNFEAPTIASKVILLVVGGILALCFLINLSCMITISRLVIKRSNKARRYSYSATQKERRVTEKKAIIVQSLFYTGAFFITFIFPALVLFLSKRHYPLEALTEIFYPLQGFWNFILYTRPGVKRVKGTNPDKSCLGIFREVVFRPKKNEVAIPDAALQCNIPQMLRAFDSEEIQESDEKAIVMETISVKGQI